MFLNLLFMSIHIIMYTGPIQHAAQQMIFVEHYA